MFLILRYILISAVLLFFVVSCDIEEPDPTTTTSTALATSSSTTSDIDVSTTTSMPEDAGPVFTEDLFQLDKINNIYPLGQLNGGYEESSGLSQATIQLKQAVIDAEDMEALPFLL